MKPMTKLIIILTTSILTALLIIILFGLIRQNNRDDEMMYYNNNMQQSQQRRLRMQLDGYADPKTVTIKQQSQPQPQQQQHQQVRNVDALFSLFDNHNIIDEGSKSRPAFDPASYAYLIIHYHKTGHHLSRQLRDFLVAGTGHGTPPMSDGRENAFQHRWHERGTGCPRAMVLRPGIVAVQAAPDFFCAASVLAEYLLRDDDGGGIDDNGMQQQQQQQQHQQQNKKRGIKIIHLVRNPYSLAVSNWVYHAQYPTPEQWVKDVHPCIEERWFDAQAYRDLVRSTLLVGNDPIMQLTDFDELRAMCTSLYRTGDASKGSKRPWNYYTHLRHLDPRDALAMATGHMLIQGITGGDIVRMANNVVKLDQVMYLEDQIRSSSRRRRQHNDNNIVPDDNNDKKEDERMIQVMTMSMEEFTHEPYAATMRFLDFALEGSSSSTVKEQIAVEYEKSYNDKIKKGDKHITNDKSITNGGDINIAEKKEEMIEYLRKHRLFGRVLGNIERLIDDALEKSSR